MEAGAEGGEKVGCKRVLRQGGLAGHPHQHPLHGCGVSQPGAWWELQRKRGGLKPF